MVSVADCVLQAVQCCTLYGNATYIANTRYRVVAVVDV